MVKYILGHFLKRLKGQLLFVFVVAETKFSVWNLFELASYGKSDFSRPDLDGKKLAEGIYVFSKKNER